jgi:hypothetical protein
LPAASLRGGQHDGDEPGLGGGEALVHRETTTTCSRQGFPTRASAGRAVGVERSARTRSQRLTDFAETFARWAATTIGTPSASACLICSRSASVRIVGRPLASLVR